MAFNVTLSPLMGLQAFATPLEAAEIIDQSRAEAILVGPLTAAVQQLQAADSYWKPNEAAILKFEKAVRSFRKSIPSRDGKSFWKEKNVLVSALKKIPQPLWTKAIQPRPKEEITNLRITPELSDLNLQRMLLNDVPQMPDAFLNLFTAYGAVRGWARGVAIFMDGKDYVLESRTGFFGPAGELILRNANSPAFSSFGRDYRIFRPEEPLPEYVFRPFVPKPVPLSGFEQWKKIFGGNYPRVDSSLLEMGYCLSFDAILDSFVPGKPLELLKTEPQSEMKVVYRNKKGVRKKEVLSGYQKHVFTKNGHTISILVPPHPSENLPTLEELLPILNRLPDLLLRGLTEVHILDFERDANASMSREGILSLFQRRDDFGFLGTVLHELGHLYAVTVFKEFDLRGHARWLRAIVEDKENVSGYAQTNTAEDFAETVALYFITGGGVVGSARRQFKNRFAILDDYFVEAFTPEAHEKVKASAIAPPAEERDPEDSLTVRQQYERSAALGK